MNKKGNIPRNKFTALCQLLSEKSNQCYSLSCGKCRVSQYIPSFKKIIAGLHPDDIAKWGDVVEYNFKQKIGPYGKELNEEEQKKLSEIVSLSNLQEINLIARFPDWLGYLGWVVSRCEGYDKQTNKLTNALVPQLLELVNKNSFAHEELSKLLINNDSNLNIKHLELVENNFKK